MGILGGRLGVFASAWDPEGHSFKSSKCRTSNISISNFDFFYFYNVIFFTTLFLEIPIPAQKVPISYSIYLVYLNQTLLIKLLKYILFLCSQQFVPFLNPISLILSHLVPVFQTLWWTLTTSANGGPTNNKFLTWKDIFESNVCFP